MKRLNIITIACATTVLLAAYSLAQTETQNQKPAPTSSSDPEEPRLQVRQIDGSLHALGDVRFDVAKRTIEFPATINMSEGAIEFALVGTQGKIHESVLATDIRPVHLRTVLSLLNFEPSAPPKTEGSEANTAIQPALAEIDLSWAELQEDGTPKPGNRKRLSLRECIVVMDFERLSEFDEKVHLLPLPKGPWTYTGSRFDDMGFEAERELDFIAVQNRPSALFNLPFPNTDRDDLWQANPKVLPKIGTAVTVEITLPAIKKAE